MFRGYGSPLSWYLYFRYEQELLQHAEKVKALNEAEKELGSLKERLQASDKVRHSRSRDLPFRNPAVLREQSH